MPSGELPLVPALKALTELQKSQRPVTEQVTEACRILTVHTEAISSEEKCQEQVLHTRVAFPFLGREQWVLKWLLKRLRAEGTMGASVRSDPRAWRLLRLLLHRIPMTSLARHLNGHHFLSSFASMLEEAIQAGHLLEAGHRSIPAEQDESTSNSSTSRMSESSSTMAESPVTEESVLSHKRKRSSSLSNNPRKRARRLYEGGAIKDWVMAAVEVLATLIDFTKGGNGHKHSVKDDYQREYIISTLRSQPSDAARILGRSFELVRILLDTTEKFLDSAEDTAELSWSLKMVNSALAIWDNRSGMVDDVEGSVSNDVFASVCLVPVLHLLETCGSTMKPNLIFNRITQNLELLLAAHIIHPARASFLMKNQQEQEHDSETNPMPDTNIQTLDIYLSRLRAAIDITDERKDSTSSQTPYRYPLMCSICRFFLVAVKYSRIGFKGRHEENAWLEAFFVVLLHTAGISTSLNIATDLQVDQMQVLEQLLQVAVDCKLSLSTDLLRTIIVHYSNTFEGEDTTSNWTLRAKVLKLDANVFLVPFVHESFPPIARSFKNPLLVGLFRRITVLAGQTDHEIVDLQNRVQQDVLLPLMRELANARALTDFLRYWHGSLAPLMEPRLDPPDEGASSKVPVTTMLDSNKTLETLRSLLESSLNIGQITGEMEALMSSISLLSSDAPVPLKAQAFASLVVLEAMVLSLSSDENITSLEPRVDVLYAMLLEKINLDPWLQPHLWRFWKTLAELHTIWPKVCPWNSQNNFAEHESSVANFKFDLASTTFQKALMQEGVGRSRASLYRNAIECFGFMSSLFQIYNNPKDNKFREATSALQKMLELTIELLQQGPNSGCSSSQGATAEWMDRLSKAYWDGSPEGLITHEVLALTLVLLLISQYPSTITLLAAEVRQALFSSLYYLAKASANVNQAYNPASSVSFKDIWLAILESEYIFNNVDLKDALVEVLLSALCSEGDAPCSEKSPPDPFAMDCLHKLPLSLFRRYQRELALDSLSEKSTDWVLTSSKAHLPSYLSLMAKFMQVPNASAKMTTDPVYLWEFVHKFQETDKQPDFVGIAAFEELVALILKHVLSTKHERRSRTFIDSWLTCLKEDLANGPGSPFQVLWLVLVKKTLSILSNNNADLASFDTQTANAYQARFLEIAYDELEYVLLWERGQIQPPHVFIEVPLEAIAENPTLRERSNSDTVARIMDRLSSHILDEKKYLGSQSSSSIWRSHPEPNVNRKEKIHLTSPLRSIAMYKVLIRAHRCDKDLIVENLVPLLDQDPTPFDRADTGSLVREALQSLNEDERLDLMKDLAEETKDSGSVDARLLCLRLTLPADDISWESTKSALSHIYNCLCKRLRTSERIRHYRLITDCLNKILQRQNRVISQYNIEITLETIVFMTSKRSPNLPPKHAEYIYLGLCNLLKTLFISYRLRLRGRFHLVVTVMQALLRCLFTPPPTTHASRRSQPQPRPAWLPTSTSSPAKGLTSGSATAYARLLSSLADPTASSVVSSTSSSKPRRFTSETQTHGQAHHHQQLLTPATDKARRAAGQYLPYVLMTYLQCQLHMRISPEAKDALMPGIYAVFDAMTPEARAMVNAAVDGSAREILKVVWRDWDRFGRWRG